MGAGQVRRPIAKIVAGALRLAGGLILVVLLILLALRGLAWQREGGAQPPPGTVMFKTPSGPVAARLTGPAGGPKILLVHGTAAWGGFWQKVADQLAARGWRVVAIDLPPFGWSVHDGEERYDRVSQSERLAAILTTLGEPAMVVGHSFGAGPAIELALRHPRRLRGLVLVDAALGGLDSTGESIVAQAMRIRPLAELTTSATLTNSYALEPLLRSMIARKEQAGVWVPVLRRPMTRDGSTSAYAAWLPNLFVKQDGALSRQTAELRKIRVPTSLIWGDADTVTPLAQGQRLAELTGARSLQILPGVGHIPHIEDPKAFQIALDRALPAPRGKE